MLLITLTIVQFCASVSVSHDSVTMSWTPKVKRLNGIQPSFLCGTYNLPSTLQGWGQTRMGSHEETNVYSDFKQCFGCFIVEW